MSKNEEILSMLDSNMNVEEFSLFMKKFQNEQLSQKLSSAIWHKMMWQKNPDINFIKKCGITPDISAHPVLRACQQSQFHNGSINIELLETAISITPKRSIVLKDLEAYAKNYTGMTFLHTHTVDKLEPYYLAVKSHNPDKFRYLSLMYQLEFLQLSKEKFISMSDPLESNIHSNINKLLVNNPDMLIKSKTFKDNDYHTYIDSLTFYHELEKKLSNKEYIKKIKI